MTFKTARRYPGGKPRKKPQAFPTGEKKKLPKISYPIVKEHENPYIEVLKKYFGATVETIDDETIRVYVPKSKSIDFLLSEHGNIDEIKREASTKTHDVFVLYWGQEI